MNHVYRFIWNRALGVLQVTSELASTRGATAGGQSLSPCRIPGRLSSLAQAIQAMPPASKAANSVLTARRYRIAQVLVGAWLTSAMVPALAHGGAGGDGGISDSPGGVGGTISPDGQTAQNGGNTSDLSDSNDILTGGSGGAGGGSAGGVAGGAGGSNPALGGNGGDGGAAGLVAPSGDVIVPGPYSGVQGGNGASAQSEQSQSLGIGGTGAGGGGGEGGYGVIANAGSPSFITVIAGASAAGANGGNGGNGQGLFVIGSAITAGSGGSGGDGGVGVFFGSGTQGSTLTINAGATVGGGKGGLAGRGGAANGLGVAGAAGSVGAGGAGVIGAGLTIVNAGSIGGGMSGDNLTRANAITFTGGDNSLELQSGYALVGDVVASGGGANVLRLGGDVDSVTPFDVSRIGAATGSTATAYQGFTAFEKAGTGLWTLTGTTAALTPWTISGGTLSVSVDGALGSTAGALVLDGGTLQNTAALATARNVTLGANGGTLQTDANLSVSGTISGQGGLTKTGAGTLTLAGINTYSGSTRINSGVLQIADAAALSSGTITLSGGTLAAQSTTTLTQSVTFGANALSTIAAANGTTLVLEGNTIALPSGATARFGSADHTGTIQINPNGFSVGHSAAPNEMEVAGGTLRDDSGILADFFFNGVSAVVDAGATLDLNDLGDIIPNLEGAGTLQMGTASTSLFSASQGNFSGSITGTHGLLKSGSGTLVLAGANTYTGATSVTGGMLQVDGSLSGSGSVSVNDTGTLSGGGSVGATTVTDGGHLAPGSAAGRILTINGDLGLSSGSFVDYALGAPGTQAAADTGISGRVAVVGNLTLDGTLNLQQSGNLADGTAGLGYYRLMTYGGTLDDEGLQVNSSLPSTSAPVIQAGSGHVDLFIGSLGQDAIQQWQGGDGNWDAAGTSWQNEGGEVPAAWAGKVAVFKDSGTNQGGTIAVQGTQSFQGLQFVDEGYVLNGPGTLMIDGSANSDGNAEIRVLADRADIATTIAGSGGITKTEAGTLVLSGVNTYTGGTTISAGTLSVSQDANLGDGVGKLTLDGGTLRVTGTTFKSTTRPIVLGSNGGAFDIAETGNAFTVAQSLSGTGGLTVLGNGGLILAGDNTYTGGTTIAGGTLIVGSLGTTGSIVGDVVNNGRLGFVRNDDVMFAGNISGSGEVAHAGGTLTLTGNNTYTGDTIIVQGAVQVGNGGTSGSIVSNVQTSAGTTLAFDRSDAYSFGGAVSGAGALRQIGAGTLTLTGDSSAFTGASEVAAGTLAVDGKLGGTLAVDSGATLAGIGTVGTTALARGAILAPGNSATLVGTLTVNGNLSFAQGSTYQVQTTPGATASSLVHVTSTADLAGSVVHMGPDGHYAASSTYTILTADQGLHGTFDSVSSNLAFLAPSLAYTGNDVNLLIQMKQVSDSGGGTRDIRFADAAITGNQRAVANGLQSLPTNNALYSGVLNLPEGAPPAVFNALSGEAHASTASTLQGVSDNVVSLPMDHFRANLDAGQLPGPATAQLGAGDAASLPQSAAQPVWAQVFGNWRTLGGDGNASKVSESDGGLFVGADHAVGGGWRLGGALGYTGSHSTTDNLASKVDVDSYSATIYGGKAFQAGPGKINLTAGTAYTWNDVRTKRQVGVLGLDQTLKANYGASTGQVFTELGYALPLNERITVEPFMGAAWSDLRTRGFAESGGSAALNGQGNSNDVTTTTLGLHAQTAFTAQQMQGHLHGTVGWRHAFGDVTPETTMAFGGGQAFTVAGAPIAHNATVLELGADVAVTRNTTVGVAYNGQFGAGNQQNAGSVNVNWRF